MSNQLFFFSQSVATNSWPILCHKQLQAQASNMKLGRKQKISFPISISPRFVIYVFYDGYLLPISSSLRLLTTADKWCSFLMNWRTGSRIRRLRTEMTARRTRLYVL